MARDRGGEVSKTSMNIMRQGEERRITLTLNGCERSGHCETRELLSDFIRHELGATGTHVGCEHGVCGACTVHIDGVAARSCLMLAGEVERRPLDTGESPGPDQTPRGLQQTFPRHHAFPGGFSNPGIPDSCAD